MEPTVQHVLLRPMRRQQQVQSLRISNAQHLSLSVLNVTKKLTEPLICLTLAVLTALLEKIAQMLTTTTRESLMDQQSANVTTHTKSIKTENAKLHVSTGDLNRTLLATMVSSLFWMRNTTAHFQAPSSLLALVSTVLEIASAGTQLLSA